MSLVKIIFVLRSESGVGCALEMSRSDIIEHQRAAVQSAVG
jgi:hypothetical protein